MCQGLPEFNMTATICHCGESRCPSVTDHSSPIHLLDSFNFLKDHYIMLYLCVHLCVHGEGYLKARPVRCHHTLISFYAWL